jgi:hypothetical protein
MADGVPITAGSGTTILTDDTGAGGHAQVVKLAISTDGSGTLLPADATNGLGVGGNVAHDGSDAGNPVKVGARAISDLAGSTMVAAGDRADSMADLDGVQLVRDQCPLGNVLSERVTNTNGTSTAFSTFGATASARNHVTCIVVHNDSAADGFVDIRDGTAGAVLMTVPCPAKGGSVVPLNPPLRQPTANTALAYDVSAAITTVYITVVGFKSKA